MQSSCFVNHIGGKDVVLRKISLNYINISANNENFGHITLDILMCFVIK
jgi:hypothetical protein